MKDEIKKIWKIKPEQRTLEEKLKLFLSDEDYGIAHIYKDGRLCPCNNKDSNGLYLDKKEADILLGFIQYEPEVREMRVLKVGSIKNKYLRRLCLILWHIPLTVICVTLNTITFLIALVKVIFSKIHYINKDFVRCWKAAK